MVKSVTVLGKCYTISDGVRPEDPINNPGCNAHESNESLEGSEKYIGYK